MTDKENTSKNTSEFTTDNNTGPAPRTIKILDKLQISPEIVQIMQEKEVLEPEHTVLDNADGQPAEETAPVVGQMNTHDAVYHLFQLEKHSYESETDYIERKMLAEHFKNQLAEVGLSPADFLRSMKPSEAPRSNEYDDV